MKVEKMKAAIDESQSDASMKVAKFFNTLVERSKYSQKEIADLIGFKNANVITILKQNKSKIPVDKVVKIAKALNTDRVELFKLVMKSYEPEKYNCIVEIYGEPVNDSERKLLAAIKECIPDYDTNFPLMVDSYIAKIKEALTSNW